MLKKIGWLTVFFWILFRILGRLKSGVVQCQDFLQGESAFFPCQPSIALKVLISIHARIPFVIKPSCKGDLMANENRKLRHQPRIPRLDPPERKK
jgi:hypothetical protein